jgi:hypothetical protein
MEASHQVPQVEKKLYKNNTAGWLGVVAIDHQGKDMGVVIEPHGTIWLSDAEAILTARAPKDPKDNPFEEQEFIGIDSNGARKPFRMRPLTLVSDESRFVPSQERYVPILDEASGRVAATAAARADSPGAVTEAAAARTAEIVAEGQPVLASSAEPPAPESAPQAGTASLTSETPPAAPPEPVPPAPAGPSDALQGETPAGGDEPVSWTEPSPHAGQVVPGQLGGSDEPGPEGAADTPSPEGTAAPVPAQGVPTAPGGAPRAELPDEVKSDIGEEHAAAVDPAIGEETGQAKPPEGDAPEGEFAQAEEVGSPDAPTHAAEE